MKARRWAWPGALALLLALAVGYGFRPRPLLVETAAVSRGPLQVTLEAEGRTRVRDRYVISAPVAGVARRIDLDVGDPVRAGQVVAWLAPLRSQVLDPRSRALAQARLAAAEAGLRVAQANAEAAAAATDYTSAELRRLRRLRETGVVSQDALDQAETAARRASAEHRSAASAVEVARYELEAARAELRFSAAREAAGAEPVEQVTLTAPADGVVLTIHQRSEYVVEPGRPLLEIGDPRRLEVEVDVLSSDAVAIRAGTPVRFLRWGGDGELAGRVRIVEPSGFTKVSALGVEEQRVWVIVDFVDEDPAGAAAGWRQLGDGYRVEARFVLWRGDDVLRVPAGALLRDSVGEHAGTGPDEDDGGGWAVFVDDDGRARLTAVELGRHGERFAEVRGGLAGGERVVLYPDDEIADGVRLRSRAAP